MEQQTFNGKIYYLYKNEKYFSKGCNRLHRIVWEHYNYTIPKGYDIHHIDGNTINNDIENLQLMESIAHAKLTGKQRAKDNPEWFKYFWMKGVESAKEWHASKEGLKWHSEHGKRTWENRPYKTLICQECSKEYQTRHGGESKFCHQNCKAKAFRRRHK